jgi:CheY-like chemotaxis protein
MLGELGLATAEAGRGDEALAILAKDSEIDVLFADLGLPDMDGFALLAEARRLRPDLAIVIVSGATPASVRAQAPPGAQFVQKPFESAQLKRAFAAL